MLTWRTKAVKGCASIIPDANGRVYMAVCLRKGCEANPNTSNDRTYTYDMRSHEVGARALAMVHLAARGEGVRFFERGFLPLFSGTQVASASRW